MALHLMPSSSEINHPHEKKESDQEDNRSVRSWDIYESDRDDCSSQYSGRHTANSDKLTSSQLDSIHAEIVPQASLQSYAENAQYDLNSDTASTAIPDYTAGPSRSSRHGKAGWVYKMSSYLKQWRRRYAFIDNDYELHFASNEEAESHAFIDLRHVRAVRKVPYESQVSKGIQWISSSLAFSWGRMSAVVNNTVRGGVNESNTEQREKKSIDENDFNEDTIVPPDQYVIEIPTIGGEVCLMYAEISEENDEWIISLKNKILNANVGFSLYQSAEDNSISALVDILHIPGVNVNYTNEDGQTPLFIAASKGNSDIVKLLIDANADIDKCNKDGVTPLHIAAYRGQLEIVQILIDFSADVDLTTYSKGFTSLFCAVESCRADIAKLLITAGADINKAAMNNWTPLYLAVENNDVEMALVILEGSPNLNVGILPNNTTALHRAVQLGNKDLVYLLIEANADVNVVDTSDDITPLYLAADGGHLDIARSLITAGAEVDYFTRAQQRTPLLAAVYNNDLAMVNMLLSANADVRGTPTGGNGGHSILPIRNTMPALEAATYFGFSQIASALRSAGASNHHSSFGRQNTEDVKFMY